MSLNEIEKYYQKSKKQAEKLILGNVRKLKFKIFPYSAPLPPPRKTHLEGLQSSLGYYICSAQGKVFLFRPLFPCLLIFAVLWLCRTFLLQVFLL